MREALLRLYDKPAEPQRTRVSETSVSQPGRRDRPGRRTRPGSSPCPTPPVKPAARPAADDRPPGPTWRSRRYGHEAGDRGQLRPTQVADLHELGGRYWDRTSDLLGVNYRPKRAWSVPRQHSESLSVRRRPQRSAETRGCCCISLLYISVSHRRASTRPAVARRIRR